MYLLNVTVIDTNIYSLYLSFFKYVSSDVPASALNIRLISLIMLPIVSAIWNVGVLILIRTNIVTGDIDLYSALGILQFHEGSLTHDTTAHDTAGDTYRAWLSVVFECLFYFFGKCVRYILSCGIRLYPHLTQLLHAITSYYFLFTQF